MSRMKGDWAAVDLPYYAEAHHVLKAWAFRLFSSGEFPYARTGLLGLSRGELDNLGRWTLRHRVWIGKSASEVHECDGAVLFVNGEAMQFTVLARTEKLLDELTAPLGAPESPADDGKVTCGFWSSGRNGGDCRARLVGAQQWDAVSANYAGSVRDALAGLCKVTEDSLAGRMVLLYGPPGTGKTTFLRALAREWKDWATMHYITDPESMLERPDYINDVLLPGDGPLPGEKQKYRLVILEDAGELISADAKREAGQALARLLNATDGIMGEGAKVVVAITCNEDIRELHPAVTREGRCLAKAEFAPLSAAEASAWLGRPVTKPMTIAELYAAREGTGVAQTAGRTENTGAYL